MHHVGVRLTIGNGGFMHVCHPDAVQRDCKLTSTHVSSLSHSRTLYTVAPAASRIYGSLEIKRANMLEKVNGHVFSSWIAVEFVNSMWLG